MASKILSPEASRLLGNAVALANILLNSIIMFSVRIKKLDEISKVISRLDKVGVYLITIYMQYEGGEDLLRFLVVDGNIVGAHANIGGAELFSEEALIKATERPYTTYRVIVHKVPENIVEGIDIITEVRKHLRAGKPLAEIAVKAPRKVEKVAIDISRDIASYLNSIDVKVRELRIVTKEDEIKANVSLSTRECKAKPREVAWIIVERIIAIMGEDRKIDINVVFNGKKKSFEFTSSLSRRIARLIGIATRHILANGGLHVKDVKYKISKSGEQLEMKFILEKELGATHKMGITDLAKECYKDMKNYWDGNLRVILKMGILGLEGRAP